MAGFRNHICQKSVYSVVVEGSEIYTHFNTVLSYVTEEGLLTYTAGLDACIPIRGMSTSYPSPAPSNADLERVTVARVIGFLLPMWEAWINFQVPGFRAQAQQHFSIWRTNSWIGKRERERVSFCHSAFK